MKWCACSLVDLINASNVGGGNSVSGMSASELLGSASGEFVISDARLDNANTRVPYLLTS